MKLLNLFGRVLVDTLTEIDNVTYCPVRITYFVIVIQMCIAFGVLLYNNPSSFDLMNWSTAVVAVLGAGSGSVAWKDRRSNLTKDQ